MILKLETQTLADEFSQLGVHPASEAIFLHKSEIVPLKLLNIRTPATNIIKQEMLACGDDCAIPAGCVVCAEERVDAILCWARRSIMPDCWRNWLRCLILAWRISKLNWKIF